MKIRDLFVSIGFDVDESGLKRLDTGVDRLKTNIRRIAAITAGAAAGIGVFLKYGGEYEQTNIAFETMLGSGEKAKQLLNDLSILAMKSPFTLPEVEQNAKLLLGMGIEAEKTVETMKALGDVASGLSVPLWRLALNYGQVKAQGKMTGRELRDFAVAGVPMLEELSKILGVSTAQVVKMMEKGLIGFPLVELAFKNMTSFGGRFWDMMGKQAKAFFGILSNIKDFLIKMARDIGMRYLPEAKKWAQFVLTWLEKNRSKIMNLAGDFGRLAAAIKWAAIAVAALIGFQVLSSFGFMVTGIMSVVKAVKILGNVALVTQLKMIALPIIVLGLLAAIVLVFEDIYSYFKGDDSLTGKMFAFFDKQLPASASKGMKVFRWFYEFIKTCATASAMLYTELERLFNLAKPEVFEKYERFLKLTKDIVATLKELWEARREIVWDAEDKMKSFISDLPGGNTLIDFLSGNIKKEETYDEKFRNVVFGGRGMPRPELHNFKNQPQNVNVNAPITVSVPPGTSPAAVGDSIQNGVRSAMTDLFRKVHIDTAPQVEY